MSFLIHKNDEKCEKIAKNTNKNVYILKVVTFLAISIELVVLVLIVGSTIHKNNYQNSPFNNEWYRVARLVV